jgi:hypothetical protein
VQAGSCVVVKSEKAEDYASVNKVTCKLRGRVLLKALKKLDPVRGAGFSVGERASARWRGLCSLALAGAVGGVAATGWLP